MQSSRTKFSKIVAFGNSYSDNSEAYKISTIVKKNNPKRPDIYIKPGKEVYWANRYSNGYTSVEIMAQMLEIELINFATGGATSGRKNYTEWMDTYEETGVLGQIDKYLRSLKIDTLDPATLYFIFPFENDYFKYIDFGSTDTFEDLCNESINHLICGLKALAIAGAKRFFIVECSDLSLVPYEQTMGRTNVAREFTCNINRQLPKTIKNFMKKNKGIDICLFKHTNISAMIQQSPMKYGFNDLSAVCQRTYPKTFLVKPNADSFYFWDEWHFSKIVHKIFGEKMYECAVAHFEKKTDYM